MLGQFTVPRGRRQPVVPEEEVPVLGVLPAQLQHQALAVGGDTAVAVPLRRTQIAENREAT